MNVRLTTLSLFCEVARSGSFSEVARLHNLPPSSVSRQIDILEKQLKTQLFLRSTRSLSLTDAGHRYLARLMTPLEDISAIHRELADKQDLPSGLLRVSSPTEFTRMQLSPRLWRFLKQCPDVTIDLAMNDHFVDLVQTETDVAIRFGLLRDSSLIARKIADDKMLICAAPEYLNQNGVPEFPYDLTNHNCLIFQPPGDNAGTHFPQSVWSFVQGEENYEVRVTGNMQATSVAPLITAALTGLGIIIAPQWSVEEQLGDGRFRRLLGDYEVGWLQRERAIYAVYTSARYLPKKVRAFIDFLISDFRENPV